MALFGKSKPQAPVGEGKTSFVLSFEIEGEDPFEVDIEGKIVIGSGPKCSISLEDFDLAPRHFVFSQQEDMLTLNYLGPEGSSKIGKQKLSTNKMYILEDDDHITTDGIVISVSKVIESEEEEEEDEDELEDDFDEDTMLSSNKSALEDLEKEEPPPDDFDEVTVARLIATETGENERPTKEKLEPKPKPKPAPAPPPQNKEVEELEEDVEEEAPEPKPKAKAAKIDFGEDDGPKRTKAIRVGARPPRIAPVKRTRVKDFNPPGFVGRLFSVLFSGSIVYMGYQSSPKEDISSLQAKTIEVVGPYLDKLKELVTHEAITPLLDKELLGLIAFFLLLWIGFELVQALILGGPLGLLIQGYRDQGGFVGKRIKALLRMPLVILSMALPIFFLPVLWGARPLSDVLTGTKWMAPPTWRHALGKIVLIPLVVALAFLSSDLLKLHSEGAWPEATLIAPDPSAQTFKSAFNRWSTWRILPQEALSGWRLKADKLSTPLIFESKRLEGLLSFWQLQLSSNPLLAYTKPELAEFLAKPNNNPSELANAQALEVLKSTLMLSLDSLAPSLATFGPFIKAPLAARSELLTSLPNLKRDTLFFQNFQKRTYLVAEYQENDSFIIAMIPLLSSDGESYVLRGPKVLRDDATNIIEALFKGKIPSSWNANRSREALSFSRIWPFKEAFETWTPEQISESSNLLRSLGGEALGGDTYPFARELLGFMKSLQKETQSKIPTFSQFLDKAILAVEQRDPSFFIGEL